MSDFITKVSEIQTKLKAPKNRKNTFGNYNYRSCEDILEAVKPLCREVGIILTLKDEPIDVNGWHYVKATATLTDGKDSISTSASAREAETKKGMDDSQISGTASSYARKYALNGLFLIDDTKDADTDEYQKERKGREAQSKADKEADDVSNQIVKETNISALIGMCEKTGSNVQDIYKYYGIKDGSQMTMKMWLDAMRLLEKKDAKNGNKS